jgi:hypothetical protein
MAIFELNRERIFTNRIVYFGLLLNNLINIIKWALPESFLKKNPSLYIIE